MAAMTFPQDEFGVEQQALERRRAMAQALAGTQAPQGRMVGRIYAPPNPLEYLAAGLRQFSGRKDLEQIDKDQVALGQRQRAQGQQELQGVIQALRGSPSFETPANEMGDEATMQNAVPGDPMRAAQTALLSQNPQLQQMGMGMLKEQIMPQKPMVVGRSLVDPKTGKVVGIDSTWQAEQQAAREAKMAELQQRSADQRLAAQERAEAQRQLVQMQIDARQQLAAFAASNRQAPKPQLITNEQGTFQVGQDGVAQPVIGADGKPLPGKPKLEKALPTPAANALGEQALVADATKRFADTFQDKFGGKTVLGDTSNTLGRVFGDDTGQSQWWQDYAFHRNKVRNSLFGSALTTGEQKEWEKADITPRMDSSQIKKNLQRRAELENKALDRLVKSNVAAGYNKEQIRALTGREDQPASAPSGFKIIGVK